MERKKKQLQETPASGSGAAFFGPQAGAVANGKVNVASAQDCTGLLQTPADPTAAETMLVSGGQTMAGNAKKRPAQHKA